MKLNKSLMCICLFAGFAETTLAVTFDFESQPHAILPSVVSTVDGLTLTASSTVYGGHIFVARPSPSYASVMGQRHIIGLNSSDVLNDGFAPVRMDFSRLLTSVSLIAGDGGGDDDGFARLRAFSSSGIEIASDTIAYPADFDGLVELSVTGSGISYVIADTIGAPSNLHSLSWDNVTVIPVPECSSSVMLFTAVCAGLLTRYRSSRRL